MSLFEPRSSNSEHGSPPQLSCPPPLSLPALSLPGQRPQDASDDPAASTEVGSGHDPKNPMLSSDWIARNFWSDKTLV